MRHPTKHRPERPDQPPCLFRASGWHYPVGCPYLCTPLINCDFEPDGLHLLASLRGEAHCNTAVDSERGLSDTRKYDALLSLILPAAICITDITRLIAFKEQYLRDTFIGVDACRQGSDVADFERDDPLPTCFKNSGWYQNSCSNVG